MLRASRDSKNEDEQRIMTLMQGVPLVINELINQLREPDKDRAQHSLTVMGLV